MDDFGIKYFSGEDAHHLLTSLQKHYSVTVDMEGENFCGLKLDWNYDAGYADIKTPNYVSDVLYRFQHTTAPQTQYPPHAHNQLRYGYKY